MRKIISFITFLYLNLFLCFIFFTIPVNAKEEYKFIKSTYAISSQSANLVDEDTLSKIDEILIETNSYDKPLTYLYITSDTSKEEIVNKLNADNANAVIFNPISNAISIFRASNKTLEDYDKLIYTKSDRQKALEEAIYYASGSSSFFEITIKNTVSSTVKIILFLLLTFSVIGIFLKGFVLLSDNIDTFKESKKEKEKELKELEKQLSPNLEKQEDINLDFLYLKDENDGLDKYRHGLNKIIDEMLAKLTPQKKVEITNFHKEDLKKIKIIYTDEYIDSLRKAIIKASSMDISDDNFIFFNNLVEKYNKLPDDKKGKIDRKYISKVEMSRNKLLSSFRLNSYKKYLDKLKDDIQNDRISENDCFNTYLNNLIKQIENFDKLNIKDSEVENILNIYIPHLKASIDDYNDSFENGYFEENLSKKMQSNIIDLIKNISQSILDKTNSKIYWELSQKNSALEGLNTAIKLNH